jgi:hypothetical protein
MDARIIVGSLTLAGVIINIVMQICFRYLDNKQKNKIEKKEKIHRQLEEFYKPLSNYLHQLKALNRLMSKNKPDGFRLLTFLLNKEQTYTFSETVKKKYEQTHDDIVMIEKMFVYYDMIEELINTKSSLINDEELFNNYIPNSEITDIKTKDIQELGLIAILINHFHLMRSAYEGQISDNEEKYKAFVYPREVNAKLKLRMKKLDEQLDDLSK